MWLREAGLLKFAALNLTYFLEWCSHAGSSSVQFVLQEALYKFTKIQLISVAKDESVSRERMRPDPVESVGLHSARIKSPTVTKPTDEFTLLEYSYRDDDDNRDCGGSWKTCQQLRSSTSFISGWMLSGLTLRRTCECSSLRLRMSVSAISSRGNMVRASGGG